MEPKITFRLPQDLYDKAKDKARSEDVTLSQALRRFLRDWVEDDELAVHPNSQVQQPGKPSGGDERGG
jgi:Arc/MetJ-type ribon-helix-helix transcriptional regulator